MPFQQSISTKIKGLVLYTPKTYLDSRGWFMETWKSNEFEYDFCQDNHSRSKYGVLRGLHFQYPPKGQAKLVRCTRGEIFDVAVDLRPDSPTYKQWESVILNEENKQMFLIPSGFAHGFVALSDITEIQYKCSANYSPECDGGVIWNDPDINIQWPVIDKCISDKDLNLPTLKEIEGRLNNF